MDTDSFVLSVSTHDIIKDLKNLAGLSDFSILTKDHEIFSNNNKKIIVELKTETPKNMWIDEFICSKPKACSFKCEKDIGSRIKLKGVSKSQSKHKKFEGYKNCLDGEDYQKNVINTFFDQLIMKGIFKK